MPDLSMQVAFLIAEYMGTPKGPSWLLDVPLCVRAVEGVESNVFRLLPAGAYSTPDSLASEKKLIRFLSRGGASCQAERRVARSGACQRAKNGEHGVVRRPRHNRAAASLASQVRVA